MRREEWEKQRVGNQTRKKKEKRKKSCDRKITHAGRLHYGMVLSTATENVVCRSLLSCFIGFCGEAKCNSFRFGCIYVNTEVFQPSKVGGLMY